MKTHRKNDPKTQRPSQRPLANSGILFSEKVKKSFEEEELGYTPASLSVPELAQASAKNAGKIMKCVDFPLKVVFEHFSF